MKKIVMTMVALLTMTAAVAQDNSEKRQRPEFKKPTPEEMTTRMAENLKLDDKQQKKVLELNKEYESVLGGPGMGRGFGRGPRGPRPDGQTGATQNNNQQQRPERPQMTEEQRAQFQQMMEKRQEYDKKLKEILTDDQYKTYQEQHQRRGGRGGFGGPRGQRGPRPDMN